MDMRTYQKLKDIFTLTVILVGTFAVGSYLTLSTLDVIGALP